MSIAGDQIARKERGPVAWMAQNSVAANVMMVVLIVGGLVTLLSGIKQEVFPEAELDRIMIEVVYPGASPAEVEQGVILAVEEAVRGIDGVKEIRSTAGEGIGTVNVELLLGADKDRALNDVKSAIDRVTSFPEDVERPTVSILSNRQQVISLVLYGDVDEATMRALGEDTRRALLEDDEITFVELSGIRPLEISVEVPQAQLRKYRLTLDDIASRIRAASVETPGGQLKTESGEILLRTTERRDSGTEFEDIAVVSTADGSEVRLADIATVVDGFQDNDRSATFNGLRAVMVNVFRVGDETPITVARAAKSYAERIGPTLPEGIHISTWADTSEMYEGRVELLRRNALIGLFLVLFTLGLFLEGRLAFWVTMGIPISFAGSLLFFPAADISINMISLFAFIVTLGMVVDDAIVVGESIHKHRADGKSRMRASIDGAREVAQPVVFAILTTCVAFAPMLMVPGVMGKFFRVVPIVVIAVLIISLVESLLILPAHLSHRMPWWLRGLLTPFYLWPMKQLARLEMPRRLEHFIRNRYEPLLRSALRWRYFTFACALAIFIGTMGLVAGRIPFTFIPKVEGDLVTAQLKMPIGTPIAETERVARRIADLAAGIVTEQDAAYEESDKSMSRGLYVELGATTSLEVEVDGPVGREGAHLATIMQYMVDPSERALNTAEFVAEWRKRIGETPGIDSLTFSYEVGVQPGKPVAIQLIHQDVQTLEASATRLADEISAYSGLSDIDSGVSEGKEQIDFRLTAEAAAKGLTEFGLARQVRGAFFGAEAVRQQRGRDELRVYVRLPKEERASLYNIEQLVVMTPDGQEMPMSQAAIADRGRAYTAINRLDGRRVITVTADVADASANANDIVGKIVENELPALMADIPGLTYSFGGEQQQQADTVKALGLGFMLAIIVMFSMLAVVFRSYSQPLLIMSAIPFGLVGAVWGHVFTGFELSIMSLMGLVALSGVVVNDSLILIVAINRYRKGGSSTAEAIIAGGTRRFRPILLTSLTTFLGLSPMILETSVQARFLVPMAISLGFGVLFATLIMLLLVPCSYMMLEDFRRTVSNFFSRVRGQPTMPPPPPIRDSTMPPDPGLLAAEE